MAAKKTKPARTRERAEDGRRAGLRPIGVIRSVLKTRGGAPKQGSEGAPDAWLEVSPFAAQGLPKLELTQSQDSELYLNAIYKNPQDEDRNLTRALKLADYRAVAIGDIEPTRISGLSLDVKPIQGVVSDY
jgi:hypothetical protein